MPTPDSLLRRRVQFQGHVQGVGFRYQTAEMARAAAVVGFVRNLGNGDVELVVEGARSEVVRFCDRVAERMRENIHDALVEDAAASGEFDAFEIRY